MQPKQRTKGKNIKINAYHKGPNKNTPSKIIMIDAIILITKNSLSVNIDKFGHQ